MTTNCKLCGAALFGEGKTHLQCLNPKCDQYGVLLTLDGDPVEEHDDEP